MNSMVSTENSQNSPDPLSIADGLHSLAIHLLRRLRIHDAASGLTAPRISVLSVLVFGGRRTMGELAAAEQVRLPTMTRLVQGLARDGLATSKTDAADQRRVNVCATAKGRTILRMARRRRVKALS